MSERISPNKVVTLTYRLLESSGRLLEDRTPENPFEFIVGLGQVLMAVERELQNQTVGFESRLQIQASEAYGEYRQELVAEMPRGQFPAQFDVREGMRFQTVDPDGKPVVVRVIGIEEDMVVVDGNHPLAGMDLIFEMRVLEVRDADAQEAKSGMIMSNSKRSQMH